MQYSNVKPIIKTSNEIFNFITDEYLAKKILLGCFINDSFNNDVFLKIKFLKKDCDSKSIDDTFIDIHTKTIKYFNLAKNSSNINLKTVKNILTSLSYFYLLEAFDEHCKFNDNLIEKIKIKFKNDYLNVISKVDKLFLSEDIKSTDVEIINNFEDKIDYDDELIKKYIILKKWQDKQHNFYFKQLENFYKSLLKKAYPEISNDDDLENNILTKLVFKIINKDKIVDIDTISVLSKLDLKQEIVDNFGGKAYGLAKLKSIKAKIPLTFVIPVNKNVTFKELDKIIPKEIEKFSIRSSADIEDGEKYSFAGMFDSYLNIKRADIISYIDKVKNSIKNKRLKSYIKKNNLKKPNMAVVIQEFKEPEKSGIWIGNNLNTGILEYTDGNGEKLVSGKVIPKQEIWNNKIDNKHSLMINNHYIGKELINLQKKLKTICDFEWMILDNQLVMLQFRPVTTKILNKSNNISSDSLIKGIPCSPGKIEGKLQFLNSPQESFKKGNILLAWITDPDWLPHMIKAKGVITASGGFLCHAGIICRELNIPCVTGIGGDAIKKLSILDNATVILDADNGLISIKQDEL